MVAFAIVGVSSVLAVFAPLGWPFELFSHFRPQYAAASLLIAVLLGWQRRPAYAAAALVLAGWHGMPVAQRALAEPPVACEGAAFTVVTANLRYVNERPEPFLGWLDTPVGRRRRRPGGHGRLGPDARAPAGISAPVRAAPARSPTASGS